MRQLIALLIWLCVINTSVRAAETSFVLFAAASTTNALTEISERYEKLGHGRPALVFGSSATLARQIALGAPADVYISANSEWMEYLETEGMLQHNSRRELLGNRLVIAVPNDSPVGASDKNPLKQLFPLGRIAVADPTSVPAGRYAKQALTSTGDWQSIAKHLVFTSNVRIALKWIARGEVAGGITYATDVEIEPAVRAIWHFPENSHPRITYEIAQLKERNALGTAQFLSYLNSSEARAVFKRHGFLPPSANGADER